MFDFQYVQRSKDDLYGLTKQDANPVRVMILGRQIDSAKSITYPSYAPDTRPFPVTPGSYTHNMCFKPYLLFVPYIIEYVMLYYSTLYYIMF